MTGALDGGRQGALVERAGAGHTAGDDLSPVGQVPSQLADVFVVDGLGLVGAESADLAAAAFAAAEPAASPVAVILPGLAVLAGGRSSAGSSGRGRCGGGFLFHGRFLLVLEWEIVVAGDLFKVTGAAR